MVVCNSIRRFIQKLLVIFDSQFIFLHKIAMDIGKRKIFAEARMFKTQCAKLEIKGKLLKEKKKLNADFKQKLKKKKNE